MAFTVCMCVSRSLFQPTGYIYVWRAVWGLPKVLGWDYGLRITLADLSTNKSAPAKKKKDFVIKPSFQELGDREEKCI
jgi:hypothetical protein